MTGTGKWFHTLLVFCGRGSSLCSDVRLQVYRNLSLAPSQCPRALWGHREADPTAARQQRDQWAPPLRLQTKGEHHQEGQTLPRSTGGQEQQKDGPKSALQILPWPRCAVKTRITHIPLISGLMVTEDLFFRDINSLFWFWFFVYLFILVETHSIYNLFSDYLEDWRVIALCSVS